MKKVVLGLVLSLSFTSIVSAAEQAETVNSENLNCDNFAELLASAEGSALLESVTLLTASCPNITDQIVETAISLAPATEHQQIMQVVADSGLLEPTDILLAAIAGGGDPAALSEPTAGGNLAITPASAASTPPIIGGRNGGTVVGTNSPASGN